MNVVKWFYKYIRKSRVNHLCLMCCNEIEKGEPYVKRIDKQWVRGKYFYTDPQDLCTKCCNKTVLSYAISLAPDWVERVAK